MGHSISRNLWLLGLAVVIIAVIVLLPKLLKNPIKHKRAKESFLIILIIVLIGKIGGIGLYLLGDKELLSLLFSFAILIGLGYGNFEFYIMKKRLHKNTVGNTFLVPSLIFLFIVATLLPFGFWPFMDAEDYRILRGRVMAFAMNFLIGYSAILYLRFLLLERKIGTVYFEKNLFSFLKLKKERKQK